MEGSSISVYPNSPNPSNNPYSGNTGYFEPRRTQRPGSDSPSPTNNAYPQGTFDHNNESLKNPSPGTSIPYIVSEQPHSPQIGIPGQSQFRPLTEDQSSNFGGYSVNGKQPSIEGP